MTFLPAIKRSIAALVEGACIGLGIAVYYAGAAAIVIGRNRRSVRVLMYHACEEQESDFLRGLSINTPPARLAAQLEFVRRHYQIIPVERLCEGPVPKRSVVLTFDDGFRSVYENTLPLLASAGVPATCYVVTDRLDDRSPIWINELNWFLRRHGAAAKTVVGRRLGITPRCSMPAFIQAVIDHYDADTMAGLLRELRSAFGPSEDPGRPHLNADEIAEMARRGFRFGNHTATHAVLSRLDESACRDEIGRARAVLERLPGSTDSLAYPFGRNTVETSRIARALGYTTLMDVQGDNGSLDLDHVGRINVGSDSPAVLFARMELVAPLKARLKHFGRGALFRKHR